MSMAKGGEWQLARKTKEGACVPITGDDWEAIREGMTHRYDFSREIRGEPPLDPLTLGFECKNCKTVSDLDMLMSCEKALGLVCPFCCHPEFRLVHFHPEEADPGERRKLIHVLLAKELQQYGELTQEENTMNQLLEVRIGRRRVSWWRRAVCRLLGHDWLRPMEYDPNDPLRNALFCNRCHQWKKLQ